LNYIRSRTQVTSEAWIRSIFLVMNLLVLAGNFFVPVKTAVSHSYSVVKDLFCTFNQLVKAFVPGVVNAWPWNDYRKPGSSGIVRQSAASIASLQA